MLCCSFSALFSSVCRTNTSRAAPPPIEICSCVRPAFWCVACCLASVVQSLSETWEADGGLELSSTSSSDGQRASDDEVTAYVLP